MLKKIFKLNWVNSNRRFNDLSLFHYMYCGQPDMSFNLYWNDVASQRAKTAPFLYTYSSFRNSVNVRHFVSFHHMNSSHFRRRAHGVKPVKKRNSRDRVSLMSVTGLILGNTPPPPPLPRIRSHNSPSYIVVHITI